MNPEKNSTPLPTKLLKTPGGSPVNRVLIVILMLLAVIFGVIVFVLVSGSLNTSQPNQASDLPIPAKSATTSATVTPTPKDEGEEAEQIDIGSDSASFQDVQKDLQGL